VLNTYRPAPSSNWLTVLKVILLIIALYLSALILGRLFTWIFAIAFALIKVIVFFVVSILVLHFFVKLLFGYDLLKLILGSRFRRY
jgi:hypothetical protein